MTWWLNTPGAVTCCPLTRIHHRHLEDWLVGIHPDGDVVACVSLYHYSRHLAEVRSLVVSDRVKGKAGVAPSCKPPF
ncbi:MAG: hypothetical protein M5U34_38945 [Chloroflexi bacterium]|nr:hypothetical protein [Chloroflexota bacterium]